MDFQEPAYDLYELNPVWTVKNIAFMLAGPRPLDREVGIGSPWARARDLIRLTLIGAIESGNLVPINSDWLVEELRINKSGNIVPVWEVNLYEMAQFKREHVITWMEKERIMDTLQRQGHQVPSETIELIERIESVQQKGDIVSSSNAITKAEKNGKELIFRRNGDTWQVGFEDVKSIKHSYGMTYIQFLLSHPNNNYSCLELELTENRMEDLTSSRKFFSKGEGYKKSDENPGVNKSNGKQDVDESFYVLKKELREAKNAVEQAEREGSLDAGLLQDEYHKQLKYFKSLYDKNGNLYEDKIEAEKVRKRVSKAIKTARNNINHHLSDLEEILKYLDLGHFPVFNPPIDNPRLEIITD